MRSNYFLFLFAVLFVSLPVFTNAQKENKSSPFFIIQLTDIQFGMIEENKGFEQETQLYEKAVAEINRLHPAFVVITGDFVHNPNDYHQINEFKRITAKIDSAIPVYLVPGNHDVGQVPDNESLDTFKANYGNDRFSFEYRDSRFIGLNSSLIKANLPEYEEKQFKWLKKALKKSKNMNPILVFTHYPFFIQHDDEPERYSNLSPEKRKKYLQLFKEYRVDAVFSGHFHQNACAVSGGTEYVVTSALGKPHGKAASGFRIIKIAENKIEQDFYELDNIPKEVTYE